MNFFASCQIGLVDFEFILLNFFSLLKVEVFNIIAVNRVENLRKKKTFKKELSSFLKRSLSRKRCVMIGKTKLLITQIYN
jgi:hypothetical protein